MIRANVLIPLAILAGFAQAGPGDPIYAPLRLYQGTWRVTTKNAGSGAKPDTLLNRCSQLGKFFACEQNVNGSSVGLLVYVPAGAAGTFHTQTINPEGRAQGRGDLAISRDQWVFTSRWDQGGNKTTFYRTTNTFSGKDHIHFEQAESPDNRTWTVTNSGDEVRTKSVSQK
jgi:hypothetical protein